MRVWFESAKAKTEKMDQEILKLKEKQKLLNFQAKIIKESNENQKNRLHLIYSEIFNTIESFVANEK